MKPLKKRDIPDESRPLALMNYTNALGTLPMAKRVMIGLGEQFKNGKDYFGATKHVHLQNRVIAALKTSGDKKIVEIIARDYRNIVMDRIKKAKCPPFIERNLLSLVAANHRNFLKTLNNDRDVKVSDTTGDDSKENDD